MRGERSRELLAELGLAAEVTGNPALLLGDYLHAEGDPELVGVNLGIAERIWGNDPDLVLDQVAEFARTMIARGHRVRLVPVWTADLPYMREAARRTGKELELIEPSSVQTVLDAIAGCGTFVGQRLSSVALASAVLVPSVTLAYQPKCVEFPEALGLDEFTLRTDSLLVEDLLDRIDALRADRCHRDRLATRVGALVMRLHEELDAISAPKDRSAHALSVEAEPEEA